MGKVVFSWLFERTYLNNAAFLHAISTAEIAGVKAYGANNRFIVAPNCIDPSLMPREVDGSFAHQRIPESIGKRLFVYVGRLDPEQKGLDLLVRAWAGLPSREGLVLVLVGPDWRDGRARIQALVDALGIADSVRFFGVVSGRDKWDLLASSDVFVHPSRWEAGVPFSVLEAMLAGRPVLLTKPSDPDGLVIRSDAGLVVPSDEQGIRSGLLQLAEADATELGSLGLAAHDLVVDRFSWRSTAESLLDAYENAAYVPRPSA